MTRQAAVADDHERRTGRSPSTARRGRPATHTAATTRPKAASAPRRVRSRTSQTPIPTPTMKKASAAAGSVHERHARGRRDRAAIQVGHVAAGEGKEETRHEGAVRVASTDREPGQRHGLGRPGHGHGRTPELDGRGHREGRDPGPDRQEPEQVPLAIADDEGAADAELRERDEHEEEALDRRPGRRPGARSPPRSGTRRWRAAGSRTTGSGRRAGGGTPRRRPRRG